MADENPHNLSEYKYVRPPLADADLSEARKRVVSVLCDHFEGCAFPVVPINIKNLAQRADVSRRTIQRFFERFPNLFELIEERPGEPNIWRIRWDFTLKRTQDPGDPDPCPGHHGGGCDTRPLRSKKNNADYYQDDRPINWNKMALWLKSKLREKVGRADLVEVILKFFKDKSTARLAPEKARWFLSRINRWLNEIKGRLTQPLHRFFDGAYKAIGEVMRGYHEERHRGPKDDRRQGTTSGLEPLSGEQLNRSQDNDQGDPENQISPAEEEQRIENQNNSNPSLNRSPKTGKSEPEKLTPGEIEKRRTRQIKQLRGMSI